MKHKVSELEGPLLDAAVAIAEGFKPLFWDGHCTTGPEGGEFVNGYNPSENWSIGGPIIQRERIDVCVESDQAGPSSWSGTINEWQLGWRTEHLREKAYATGPTPLIAAMRAFVSAKLGDEVELPGERGG